MVFYRERDNERPPPPLSLILPHLYLGAETDVTQDGLSARGISYVLSVSRCSPQPTFLPCSQYLRIPIDDSLRDDLLPWIPKALGFIDGAMSSGCSVLVHCAAGISRSPALAVAYIMYSLGMDLDHAYRFVKDRRPSISPNFNFLGQLQQFQGTLTRKSSDSNTDAQPITSVDTNDNDSYRRTSPQSANQSTSNNTSYQGTHVTSDFIEAARVHSENSRNAENAEQKYFRSAENENALSFTGNMQQERRNVSPLTLSLSGKLRTLNLTLNLNQHQRDVQVPCESPPALSPCEPAKPEPKPGQLQIPTGFASLSDKRKSLTLSLSPLGNAPTPPDYHPKPLQSNNTRRTACTAVSQTVHKREMGAVHEATRLSAHEHSAAEHSAAVGSPAQMAPKRRDRSDSRTKYAQSRGKGEREGRALGKKNSCPHNTGKKREPSAARKIARDMSRGNVDRQHSAIVDQQPSTDAKPALSVTLAESEETSLEEQGLLSPLNLTFNKLLGWGERMMLGVLFAPRIKMGQAALPYRC